MAARRLRLRLLQTVLLAQVAALIYLAPRDPLLLHQIQRLLHPFPTTSPAPDYAALLRSDPALNTPLPAEGAGLTLRRVVTPSRAGYLVVPVGDCASCIRVDLPAWEREASKRGLQMVLLSSAPPARAERFRHELSLTAPVVSDPTDRLVTRLNAIWLARPYLFSSEWRLLWMPHEQRPLYDPFADPEFERALQGGTR